MMKIGAGRYQEVFREGSRVYKTLFHPVSQTEIFRMEQYYYSLKKVGVNVPEYLGIAEFEGKKASEWEYRGKPLSEAILNMTHDRVINALGQIFQMGLNAYEQDVAFYPILEQFTLLDDEVFFVDFFPSRTKEDFLGYSADKRDVLSLMFYGLTQKLVKPSKQLLATNPSLRGDVEEIVSKYLDRSSLGEWVDNILRAIDFDSPNLFDSNGTYVGINEGGIKSYDSLTEIGDSKEWVLVLPSRNVWTKELFHKDLEKIISLGFVQKL